MCWSHDVSVIFASVEAILIVFIAIRSRLSTDPYIRKQYLILPILISVFLVELIEAYLWTDPDLVSVTDVDVDVGDGSENQLHAHHVCSKWNHRLTVILCCFILPWQPLWVIVPCRRVGHPSNRQLLKVSEFSAILFGVAFDALYVASLLQLVLPNANDDDDTSSSSSSYSSSPLFDYAYTYRTLSDSNYKSYLHSETCTFLGRSGHHLHWAFAIPDTYVTPNGFTYLLLWLSVIFCRPRRFVAGIMLLCLGIFVVQFLYLGSSWEAGSVWCWSAMIGFVYVAIQPYVLPCTPISLREDATTTEKKEEDDKALTALTLPLLS